MYERFTDRAHDVMKYANRESQGFNHEYIGSEHILLGLLREGSGVAANVLKDFNVDLRKARSEVEKLVPLGSDMVTMGKLPMDPRARNIIKYSLEVYDVKNKKVGAIQKVTPPKVIVLYDHKTPDLEQIESALSLKETLEYTNYPYSEEPSSEEVAKILSEPISKILSLVERLKKED